MPCHQQEQEIQWCSQPSECMATAEQEKERGGQRGRTAAPAPYVQAGVVSSVPEIKIFDTQNRSHVIKGLAVS